MRGDTRWLVIALVLLMALSAVIALSAAAPPAPDLSIRGDDRNGAMALQLWLRRSGYDTRETYDFDALAELDVLFILQPLWFRYSEGDGEALRRWVEAGGTLIIAGEPERVNPLLAAFDSQLRYLDAADAQVSPAAPALPRPLFTPVLAEAFAYIQDDATAYTPHLFSGDAPVLAAYNAAGGQLWVAGFLHPFTNQGLSDEGAARLLTNLLPDDPRGVVVGFDEGGHGFSDPSEVSLVGWLLRTAPGWGIVSAVFFTLVFLASRGQRIGRPQPLPDERLRRDSSEYIQAIGSLFRRSGERVEILKHYNAQLRRRLSERYAVDPLLPAADMVKAVVYRDPSVDENKLRPLLTRLAQQTVSEHELISIATDVDTFLRSMT